METTFDNCNNADLNNPVQNLLQNANTEFKMDKTNEIFKTDNPFNDGLNNFVQMGDTNNVRTTTTTKSDSTGIIGMQPGDLPECEQLYNFGDEGLDLKVNEKRTFDDMGPETSVDVPDDVIMNTESSEENLSKSSLSHSKDALPLSDNLNPFDVKNSLTDLDANEFQMQDDTKTCTTPSENLLDTPVDPASLDDVKQILPADSTHTNGIHSEDDHLAEDQLPIAKEGKDIENEEDFRQIDGGFQKDAVWDYKLKQDDGFNETEPAFKEQHFGLVQEIGISEECKKPDLEEDHKVNELDFNVHIAESNKFVEKDLEVGEEVKSFEHINDDFAEEMIPDLKPTSPIMNNFIEDERKDMQQISPFPQEQATTMEFEDHEFHDRLEQKSPFQMEEQPIHPVSNIEEQIQENETTFDREQETFGLVLENDLSKSQNMASEDLTLSLDEKLSYPFERIEDTIPVNTETVQKEFGEMQFNENAGGISLKSDLEETKLVAEEVKEVPEEVKEAPEEVKDAPEEIKEIQEEIKETLGEIKETLKEIKEPQEEIKEPQDEIKEPQEEIKEPQGEIKEPQEEIKEPQGEIKESQGEITEKDEIEDVKEIRTEDIKEKEEFESVKEIQQEDIKEKAVERIDEIPIEDTKEVQEELQSPIEKGFDALEEHEKIVGDVKENINEFLNDVQMEVEIQKEGLKDLQTGFTEIGQEVMGITEQVKELLVGDEIQEIEKAEECLQQPTLEMDTKPASPPTENICQPTAPESCDESEDEWNYMRLKGEGEKEVLKSCETAELVSPVEEQQKDIIPEELPSEENLPEVELEASQEALVASANESKDTASTQSVEPSDSKLEISETRLSPQQEEEAIIDMSSQLNPEAKEFIPANISPLPFDLSNGIPPVSATRHIPSDDVVAQSPRKGLFSMDDVQVPSQIEFESDIAHCPAEIQISPEPNALYQEMNLKEAMHGSEKEDQVCDDGFGYNTDLDNVGMKDSIYIENSFGREADPMNAVQPIPLDDEICDTSKNITEESIAETTGSSSFTMETTANLASEFKPSSPFEKKIEAQSFEITGMLPGDFVTTVTQQFDKLEISEHLKQPTPEPELVKQVISQVEELLPCKEVIPAGQIKKDVSLPVKQAETLEATSPLQNEPAVPISPTGVSSPTTPTKLIDEPVELKAPVEVIESIKPVDSVPLGTSPTQPTEIKKEKETIEKVITEKIETVKPPIKVPEAKKDVKGRVSSVGGPKKTTSTTTAALADVPKPKTSHAAKPKSTTSTVTPRPRTVPLASKPPTERKITPTTAARSKIDSRPTQSASAAKKPASATTATKSKPDEQAKVGVKQTTSKTGVTARPPVTSRTSSSTSTASKARTSATTTTTTAATSVATTKSTTQRVALSATAKSASTTKPFSSPRSTLTSTLRKTEAIKSPTGSAKVSTTTTRTSSTTKSKSSTPGGKSSSTTTTITTTNTTPTAAKKSSVTSSPRLSATALKKSPIKKSSVSPVKKSVADENKKNKESNEVKLNGTTIEAAALDNKTAELIQ